MSQGAVHFLEAHLEGCAHLEGWLPLVGYVCAGVGGWGGVGEVGVSRISLD